jgi:hypothetical protein
MDQGKSATQQAPPAQIEPARIKKLRLHLARAIPRFPNDRTSLQHLQKKDLQHILVDFINWRSRYVGTRPRSVTVETTAAHDPRWVSLSAEIKVFLKKVRKGADITPHLSLEPHTRGFTPTALAAGASAEDKWSDKDFVLTAQGFHHFHLGTSLEPPGHVKRTDDLLFAHVTHDSFKVIAIFDHSVFDLSSPERQRLWVVHDQYVFRDLPPDAFVLRGAVATSGHSMQVINYANRCARTVFHIDPKLDDRSYVEDFYATSGRPVPAKTKLAWGFNHLDIGVAEMRSKVFFCLLQGWN